jgi:hypothetical protein
MKPALVITIASAFAQASRADSITIDNCLQGAVHPCFTISLGALSNAFLDAEPSPVDGNLAGISGSPLANGNVFAVAAFGRLGAKSEITYMDAIPLQGVESSALALFNDEFVWPGVAGKLRATMTLAGTESAASAVPSIQNFATVEGDLKLVGTGETGEGVLSGPGSTTATIDVSPGDDVQVRLFLRAVAIGQASGSAISDFSDTLELPRIELLDSSGNFLENVTLTDAKGNVLGAPVATVPEPGTSVLVGAGLIAVRILAGAARRLTARIPS